MKQIGASCAKAQHRRPRVNRMGGVTVGLACLLTVTGLAFGQGVTGRLVGTVQDKGQAVIPSAQVEVTNQGTGLVWKATSDGQGNYVIPFLPPGHYKVQVQAAGFQNAVSPDNVVAIDEITRVDFTMQLGKMVESVEVTAVAPQVRSTTSDMGDVLNDRQVHELPLNGRIFSQLVQTTPGAIAAGFANESESASAVGTRSAISASVNGMPSQGTTYTIDGVTNMELLNAFMNVTPPLEAIEEVRVSTNNSNADVGTYGGAQVNAYIKSGTNQLHGSLFEYLRNDALNARRWESKTKAPFKGNQFGGTLGGPIVKNKAFFFGDYQGNRLRSGQTFTFSVPTLLMRQGIFSPLDFGSRTPTIYDPKTGAAFSGNQIPSTTRFDPAAAKMLGPDIWPFPNGPGVTDNYTQNAVDQDTLNSFDVKGDYQFTNGDRLFVRESYQRRNLVAGSPGTRFIKVQPDSTPRDHNAAIGYTHSFSPALLNELRLGFNRFFTFHFGHDFGTNENTTLGIPNGNLAQFAAASGIANFQIANIQQTGSQDWTDAHRITTGYQLTDNLTWTRSRHTFKFGADVRKLQASLTNADQNQSGRFNFNSDYTSSCTGQPTGCTASGGHPFASFLLGLPNFVQRGIVNTDPATRATLAGIYGQDDLRVTKSLTLNLALRWDIITPPRDAFNNQTNFNLIDGLLHTAQPGNRGPDVNTYLSGFSPRVGIAYSPDNGRTAFRTAFGITNFPDHFGAMGGTLERNFPLFEQFSVTQQKNFTPFAALSSTSDCPNPANCFLGLPGFTPVSLTPTIAPPPNVQVYYVPQNFRPDQATMWNAGVQRQLTTTSALDVSYVGTKGTHLFRSRNIDVAFPGQGALNPRRFYSAVAPNTTNITERASDGDSVYHALQVKYTKKFSHGLQGLVAYTWSKEIDDITIFVPYNDHLNRGVGNASGGDGRGSNGVPDIAHNLVASYIYELPFGKGRQWLSSGSRPVQWLAGGWQFSGVTAIQSGSPLVVGIQNQNLNSDFNNRANVTCGHVGTVGTPGSLASAPSIQWFDLSCFAVPPSFVLGNSGKGLVRGPGLVNFDLAVFKSEKVTESKQVDFRVEFFNALNTPHFTNPNLNCCTADNANFGLITGTRLTPRELQVGLRFSF